MPTKKKTAKSGRKTPLRVRDLKPAKDAKGGARHVEGASGRPGLNRPTKNLY